MSQRSAPVGSFPGRVGKSSRDIVRCSAQTWRMTPRARQERVLRAARTGRGLRAFAAALGVFALLEVIAAALLSGVAGWSWQDALDAFVVTNSAIGMSFGICGAILAWHRPRNPIGWLFAAGGVAYATAALAAPLGAVLRRSGCTDGCAAARDHDLRLVLAVGHRPRSPADLAAVSRRTPANPPLAVGR